MFEFEKILNELTLIITIITMVSVFLFKNGIVSKGFVIFLCILTVLVYLCSKTVTNKNSNLSNKDKEKLKDVTNVVLNEKKGKK